MDGRTCFALLVIQFVCLLPPASTTTSLTPCPVGEFMHPATARCQTCSRCPMNKIIRVPCTANSDTQCGPLYASEFRYQGSDQAGADSDETQGTDFNLFKLQSERPLAEDKPAPAAAKDARHQQSTVAMTGRFITPPSPCPFANSHSLLFVLLSSYHI